MTTYIPNATQTAEPAESRTVESAALEFRTLKASVTGRIDNLQTQNNSQDVRIQAIEAALPVIAEGGLPGTVYVQRLSGTGAQTAFTLGVSVPTSALIDIFIDGIYQNKDTFTVVDNVLTFSEAPPAGTDNIEVVVSITIANVETDASLVSYRATDSATTVRTVESKLREMVSVKDFGAVGDGITDDTAAIQAAVNSAATYGQDHRGANIYFPPGSYAISNTITVPTNSPTHAFISLYGDGSPSHLKWIGATDAPILFFPHSSDMMHVFVDKLYFTGVNAGGGVYRGIGIRYGTPATPSGFVVNFSVTNCKFNTFSTCIETHGEADLVMIQKNYIGEFTVAGIKYFQPNTSGFQIIGNHFRSGKIGSTCIIGDSTGGGGTWLISGNVLQSATGMGILSMHGLINITVVNNYCENADAPAATDLPLFIFTNCRNVSIEDNLTTGRTGTSAIYQLLGTTQSVRIGNNYHGISAMYPVAWLFLDPTVVGVSLLGNLTTNGAIELFAPGSATTIDLIYKQAGPDGNAYNKALAPVNETNERKNAPAIDLGGKMTLKTLTQASQAYYVYAQNTTDNIWSFGIVSRIGSNTPEYHSIFQKSEKLVISVSGDAVIVTNGITAVRTIRYSLTRIY